MCRRRSVGSVSGGARDYLALRLVAVMLILANLKHIAASFPGAHLLVAPAFAFATTGLAIGEALVPMAAVALLLSLGLGTYLESLSRPALELSCQCLGNHT
jgi:hypothetical protein